MDIYLNLRKGVKYIPLLMSLFVLMTSTTYAQNGAELEENSEGVYKLSLYKSGIIEVDVPIRTISIANPGIVDLLILKSNQLYAVGKALGSTNVVLWSSTDEIYKSFDIEVTHDLSTLKNKLHELLPGEGVKVHSAQERIILSGNVKNLSSVDAAIEIAAGFLPDCIDPVSNVVDSTPDTKGATSRVNVGGNSKTKCKKGSVVNLMSVSGSQQVMLEVKVAEIARTLLRSMDADFNIIRAGDTSGGLVSGGAIFPNSGGNLLNGSIAGPGQPQFTPLIPGISDTGAFLSHLGGDTFFEVVLEASRQNGLAKVLAEPTVTTLTGQQATFISGGEFPVPVPGGDNDVTVTFKEFGVGVKFLPTVLNSDHINLKMNIEVSELANNNAFALGVENSDAVFFIPALTKRGASSTVELRNGQTIGIAGLISDNLRESIDKLPGIGDLPILGNLFRSQQFISGQTELVIFVTPHLAKPINRNEIRLPTDKFVPPNDYEFYILGRLDGREPAPESELSTAVMMQSDDEDVKLFGHKF